MIYHIISKTEYDLALGRGFYRPESINTEGFIHFSTEEQVDRTAKRFYAGQKDLYLLYVDESKLLKEVIYESSHGEDFPHLYADLNLEAIADIDELVWVDGELVRSKKSS